MAWDGMTDFDRPTPTSTHLLGSTLSHTTSLMPMTTRRLLATSTTIVTVTLRDVLFWPSVTTYVLLPNERNSD